MVSYDTKSEDPLSSKEEIENFLIIVREAIKERRVTVANRDKNQETLARYNLNYVDVYDIVSKLCVDDYRKGPEPDDKARDLDDVWVFIKELDFAKIYIKLSYKKNRKILVVISFHD